MEESFGSSLQGEDVGMKIMKTNKEQERESRSHTCPRTRGHKAGPRGQTAPRGCTGGIHRGTRCGSEALRELGGIGGQKIIEIQENRQIH